MRADSKTQRAKLSIKIKMKNDYHQETLQYHGALISKHSILMSRQKTKKKKNKRLNEPAIELMNKNVLPNIKKKSLCINQTEQNVYVVANCHRHKQTSVVHTHACRQNSKSVFIMPMN